MTEAQAAPDRAAHRDFLNRYYKLSRPIYDLTRKYYLFGRDTLIKQLLREDWTRLIEVGPGTGRNLRKLKSRRPHAEFGGVDASDSMLEAAANKCPWARLAQGFAEDADFAHLLSAPPDRILFSYALSMFQEQEAAINNARNQLAPGGELVIVDFSDLSGLPEPARGLLTGWLRTFHVEPLDLDFLAQFDAKIEHGPLNYFVIARISKPD